MRKNKLLLLLVLLLTAATGAWAQTETLLTTITATGTDSYSETTPGVVTVTHDNDDIFDEYGWLWYHAGSVTVEAKDGYTITKCVFRQADKNPVTVSTAPFGVSFIETSHPDDPEETKFLYNGDWELKMNGVSSIEVYGAVANSIVINGTPQVGDKSISLTYHFDPANVPNLDTGFAPTLKVKCAADDEWDEISLSSQDVSSGTTNISLSNLGEFEAGKTYDVCFAYCTEDWVDEVFQSFVPAAPAGYTVSMKDGVKDADKWTISPNPAPEGSPVTIQYTGRLKVKGVKATSDAAPAEATPALSITSPSVGQVIGSDGKNYAYGSLPTGVTAVAKICYVSGSNGLALALTDEEGTMAWSTAKTVCAAHTAPFTGGTWKLASEDEWNKMMSAAGSYSALCEGFSSVGGTNMIPYFYWSSTEFNSDLARDYDFGEGEWSADSKGEVDYVRACLAF